MNNPSLEKFQNQIQSGGIIYVNSDLINFRPLRGDIILYEVTANTLALEVGNDRAANMVMLGAFLKKTPLVKLETAQEVVGKVFADKPGVIELNREALLAGYQSIGGE